MNMPRESGEYDVEKILEAAEMVGIAGENQLLEKLNDSDSGVRYWAITGLMRLDKLSSNTKEALTGLLDDPSPSVQIAAAEVLCSFGSSSEALETLGRNVMDERPWVALQAAPCCLQRIPFRNVLCPAVGNRFCHR